MIILGTFTVSIKSGKFFIRRRNIKVVLGIAAVVNESAVTVFPNNKPQSSYTLCNERLLLYS